MDVTYWSMGLDKGRRTRNGFTLVEVIVALTVVSVALSIFISMFISTIKLAAERRDRVIASELAESYLNGLTASPGSFAWKKNDLDGNGLFPIQEQNTTAGISDAPLFPETTLVLRSAHERNLNLYQKFESQAWGRLPSPEANAYEVTVSVRWRTHGRPRMFALTSSIPRLQVDEITAPENQSGAQS